MDLIMEKETKGQTVGQTKMGLYKQTKRKQASEDWIGEQTKFEQGT